MDSIKELARSISNLGIEAVEIYKPIVNDIIVSKKSNVNEIEHALDYMLGFCYNDEMVKLYRRLCQYLYKLDENSGLYYANAYFEMYVKEEED